MRKMLLKVVNFFLIIFAINQGITGIFHEQINHELFEKIHGNSGSIFLLLISAHLYFNWGWVKTVFLKHKKPSNKD